ncbi:deoxyfructose oxidoreductase [Capsulimonas corticalis]|uniref:Deoxyfructose oxidoreductase n=1 Tax=Capsulimonas corticalis TaxID=2219043 RepID=A0A402CZR0_9BACT|nr:Gfo/Idh/MocA family oxidoreductase [Capsulimonas corticalis]BDI33872.1 deoxyfructose oxidoreductase [Capsulimonas corticalis]
MSDKRKVRWGVIGTTSRVARESAIPALMRSEHAELVAVASRDAGHAAEVAAGVGPDCKAYANYDALIADDRIDAIYIPLPNSLHVGWAVEAMNHGKNVLCEQPLTVTGAEAEEMRETAQDNGVLISESFSYWYHPLQREVAKAVQSGAIGAIKLVRVSVSFLQSEWNDYRRSRTLGGGALLDCGAHGVHIARQVWGSEPLAASASAVVDPNLGIDTTTTALLEFAGGATTLLDSSFTLYSRSTYEIVGSEGAICVPKFLLGAEETCVWTLTRPDETWETHSVAATDTYEIEIDCFSRKLLGEDTPILPIENSLANARVVDAIAQSARTGLRIKIGEA